MTKLAAVITIGLAISGAVLAGCVTDNGDYSCTPVGQDPGIFGTACEPAQPDTVTPEPPPPNVPAKVLGMTTHDARTTFAVARGGTLQLVAARSDGEPYLQPYTVTVTGPEATEVEHARASFTLAGNLAGATSLAIADAAGTVRATSAIAVAPIAAITLVATGTEELDPARAVAFAPGRVSLATELRGPDYTRLADASMVIASEGSIHYSWDTIVLPDARAGEIPIVITAGDREPLTLTALIAEPTAIATRVGLDHLTVSPLRQPVCFSALVGERQVVGLDWTLAAETTQGAWTDSTSACVGVDVQRTGTATIRATAGPLTATFTLPIE